MIAGQAAFIEDSLGVGHSPTLSEAWLVAAAGLLPDLDRRHGIVGRLFPWLSELLDYRFGHRTLTHSLLACVVLALVLCPLFALRRMACCSGRLCLASGSRYADAGRPAWSGSGSGLRGGVALSGNERHRMRAIGWGGSWPVRSCWRSWPSRYRALP